MNSRGFSLALTLLATLAALVFVRTQLGRDAPARAATPVFARAAGAPGSAREVVYEEEAEPPRPSAPAEPLTRDEYGRPITGVPGDDD